MVKLAAKNSKGYYAHRTLICKGHSPIVIGSYMLAFVEQLQRDYVRLGNCRDLLNESPLGSGAVCRGPRLGWIEAKPQSF